MQLLVGTRLGPYEIVSPLGAGGMGEVYRARDTRLDRLVAVKVVSPAMAADPGWRERFDREARAISGLNHPHICTLYDVGRQDGVEFLVMECLDGETLKDRLQRGALPLEEALRIAVQLADALDDAHRHGLIHRDIKPANTFLTKKGGAKILDFGLAKVARVEAPAVPGDTMTDVATVTGTGYGTVSYMSPEQLRGLALDRRTDLFSLGVVLYEMIAGRRPFTGGSAIDIADAILHDEPAALHNADVPPRLESIVRRLLEKEPTKRFDSATEVLASLNAVKDSRPALRSRLRGVAWLAGAGGLLVVVATAWLWNRSKQERWVRESALPGIARLLDADEHVKAAALIREARRILPKDPTLEKQWLQSTAEAPITSEPTGADVSIRPYLGEPGDWQSLGTTPLKDVRVPKSDYLWRVARAGFAPVTFIQRSPFSIGDIKGESYISFDPGGIHVRLRAEGTVPAGMVVVIRGRQTALGWPFFSAARHRLDDYLIDQHEVTNAEYKAFVDAGAYEREAFWVEPFVRDGRTIPWKEALASFHDMTGRAGPATWEVGSFPRGQEKHPVGGVSWYEAAAYARFAEKDLPTAYHWSRAAQTFYARLIVPGSTFSNPTTTPVASAGTLSGFGTADMAGNVKEWCRNEGSGGKRFILGGGYGEPTYMFNMTDARSPWERGANYGFRCVKLPSAPEPSITARLEQSVRDISKEKIVPDQVFESFKDSYTYDSAPLNARVEHREVTEEWTRETVSFDAAYGNERFVAHLFLPNNAAPPLQTVVYFPGANAFLLDRLNPSSWLDGDFGFLLKGGRAVMFPVYKGTFERRDGFRPGGPGTNPEVLFRDHAVMWSKDLSRSVDYLESRVEIDHSRLAYRGYSFGGSIAPVLLATERRFKAAVLSSAGFWMQRALDQAEPLNFVTRVKIPVLMLNGKYSDFFTVELAQRPFFQRLGTPTQDKKYVLYEAGHGSLPRAQEIRETLDWLDNYLGSIRRR